MNQRGLPSAKHVGVEGRCAVILSEWAHEVRRDTRVDH